MNGAPNPLVPQFWLWGIDAIRGDLERFGFERSARWAGMAHKSSLYRFGDLWLHANGAWLEDRQILYHRGSSRFYRAAAPHFAAGAPDLEPLEFESHLAMLQPFTAHFETRIAEQRGATYRSSLLGTPPPHGVIADWPVWRDWLEAAATPEPETHLPLPPHQARAASQESL